MTIPKVLRDRVGIRPGETLEFEADAGRLIATRVVDRDPTDDVYGALDLEPLGGSTDAFIDRLRGPADL